MKLFEIYVKENFKNKSEAAEYFGITSAQVGRYIKYGCMIDDKETIYRAVHVNRPTLQLKVESEKPLEPGLYPAKITSVEQWGSGTILITMQAP